MKITVEYIKPRLNDVASIKIAFEGKPWIVDETREAVKNYFLDKEWKEK